MTIMKPTVILVNDKMQSGYRYLLTEPMGTNFDPDFKPELSPKEMLELGVFGGKYITDATNELPIDWFKAARLSPSRHDPSLNYFGVSAGQPLSVWQEKGFTLKIHAAGFNGIVVITSGAA